MPCKGDIVKPLCLVVYRHIHDSVQFCVVQTEMPKGGEKVTMKITGALVDMMVELDPEPYSNFVVFERK